MTTLRVSKSLSSSRGMAAVLAVVMCTACAMSALAHSDALVMPEPEVNLRPSHWRPSTASVSPQQTVGFTVGLKQRNLDKLERLFWEVSNPQSESYMAYLSQKEITALVAPPAASVEAVQTWLKEAGCTQVELAGNNDALRVAAPVEVVERLFGVSMQAFESVHRPGVTIVRSTRAYTLPADVAAHVQYINGIHSFPPMRPSAMERERAAVVASVADDEALASGTNTSMPLVARLRNGDSQLAMFAALRCADGTWATQANGVCATANGGAGAITALRANLRYNTSASMSVDYDIVVDQAHGCMPCSAFASKPFYHGMCTDVLKAAGTTEDVVFCANAVKGLVNYVATRVSISTVFTNNGVVSPAYTPPLDVYTSPLVTPDLLRAHYGIPQGTRGGVRADNVQAVAEFLGQYYSPHDLSRFLADNGLPQQGVKEVIGPNDVNMPGGEAQLDIEFIMGVAPGVETVFWSVGGLHENQERFLKWIQDVNADSHGVLVHSISYDDDEKNMTASYRAALNTEFQKAGVAGMTLLFAAGDDGTGSFDARTNAAACNAITPTFPSTSQYVTAVGGTTFSTQARSLCTQNDHGFDFKCNLVGEIVSSTDTGSGITTGGGFSFTEPMPGYQKDAVAAYLASKNKGTVFPPSNMFNANGRAYPDVAGVAHNYMVRMDNTTFQVDGTSASTPLVAAMISLLNEALPAGKSMGFLNPWLYQMAASNPEAFYDVTLGNNRCTANPKVCCPNGFHAAVGWDAVTGLGTPRFDVWFNHVLNPTSRFPLASQQGPPGSPGPAGPPGPQGSQSVLTHEQSTLLYVSLFINAGIIILLIIGGVYWCTNGRRKDALLNINDSSHSYDRIRG